LFFAFDIPVSSPCFVFLEDAAAQTSQNDDITPAKKSQTQTGGKQLSRREELRTIGLLLAVIFWTTPNSACPGRKN